MKDRVVLIVDDLDISRQGTALTVESIGFDTDEASSGFEALEKVKARLYAAVLMDYNMPEMNGIECTAKIREMETATGRRTPVIAMSASEESDLREKCLLGGMDDFISKTCSTGELLLVLEKWALDVRSRTAESSTPGGDFL